MRNGIVCRLFIFLFFLFLPVKSLLAIEQNAGLWAGDVLQQRFSETSPWYYLLFTQLRSNTDSHLIRSGMLEGSIGYLFNNQQLAWLGYRYSGHHPYNGFYQSNLFYQMFAWEIKKYANDKWIWRSRLEEYNHTNQQQWVLRLRERLFMEMEKRYFGFINPVAYDEIFLQLNRTSYTSHQLISQNRLFLGGNFHQTKTSFWEIGYINQYLLNAPLTPNYVMNHILSVTYIVN